MVVVKRKPKPLLIILVFLGSFLIFLAFFYMFLTRPMDYKNKNDIEIVIPSGVGVNGVSKILKEKSLIRSRALFTLVIKLDGHTSLKASTYKLNKSMSMQKIIDTLSSGNNYNPDAVKITFKEGSRITDYALAIANATNHTYDDVIDVINDKAYLSEVINSYWFLTDDILNSNIYYPLEGYLSPDTYEFKNKDVSVKDIIKVMLDETDKKLSVYKDKIDDVHSIMTMASIVELEGTNTKSRKMIVGVFYNRLAKGMNMGSDVTTYYALQYPMTSDLTSAQFATINPYNTRASNMGGKLPVGPICNPSLSSIEASVNPTDNDYLFFVADKNGDIYYTKTNAEHDKKVKEIKEKGDWIW